MKGTKRASPTAPKENRKARVATRAVEAKPPCGADGSNDGVQRRCFMTELRSEKAEEYRALHAAVWPTVVQRIRDCHIQNYTIFEKEVDGKLLLVSYLEYTGSDWAADMVEMAKDDETKRWWSLTDPCQLPFPEARQKSEIWSEAKMIVCII